MNDKLRYETAMQILSDAIEFAEELVGGDESETLNDLKEREAILAREAISARE
jgi:hypothetical protein